MPDVEVTGLHCWGRRKESIVNIVRGLTLVLVAGLLPTLGVVAAQEPSAADELLAEAKKQRRQRKVRGVPKNVRPVWKS